LIHDNGLWGQTNYLAAKCAARLNIPLVISPHGMLEPWALQHKRTRKRIVLSLYLQGILDSAAMFAVSAPSEYESVRRAGLKQPVAIVPAGVSMPTTTALHATAATERRMLFLSRIHPKKGLIPFVEAWRQVPRPGWKVIIAGPDEGGHATEVQRLIASYGLESQFEFPGEVEGEAKRQLFESADVFVLPTFSENFGVVVAEAMSYGVPVLTTRGAPWEILETLKAGWWVDASVEGIAAGLRSALATTPEQRAEMGRAGHAFVVENLGWGVAGKKTYDAYAWLLGLEPDKPAHVRVD
jgi:glycosyltransferase involved in cell wall biosynthesis